MPKKKRHRELPSHKKDWFLISAVIVVMIIFFILLFSRFSY